MKKIVIATSLGLAGLGIIMVIYFLLPSEESEVLENSDGITITNGLKHIVPLEKIKSGGPPKDGIPSIDSPKFLPASESEFMSNFDVVIGLDINGERKAYPLFILVWHEIVNDKIGGVPVAVTYCPLCYTNQVFERILDGNEVEFGTSGKLYNSNLVMYDRLTDSQWSQALGVAITGEKTGHELKKLPFDVINWGDWLVLHPDTLVLSTDTGYIRSYGTDPYGNYYTEPRIIFPVENYDERLHPKEVILGFSKDGMYKAYKQHDVESSTIINDQIGEQHIVLISLYSGDTRAFDRTINDMLLDFEYSNNMIIDMQTKSEWNYDGRAISGVLEGTALNRLPFDPGFWFEWVAFHPETEIYSGG